MNLIPSFILSALFFCNVSVPGGFDGTTLTEGVICEIPYTSFILAVDETPELTNAAILFEQKTLSLKLAAGSLAVSGTGGTERLSAKLPGKDDGTKDPAAFVSWKNLALYGSEERAAFQYFPGFIRILPDAPFRTECSNALTAGWTKLTEPSDTGWFLRYPWHGNGDLYHLEDVLSVRLSFTPAKLTVTGTAALSCPDIIPPEIRGALSLLLKTKHTETSLSYAATPASFVMPTGSFTSETGKADAQFSFQTEKLKLTAAAGLTDRQPAKALELSKRLFSAELSGTFSSEKYKAGVSVQAGKLCFDDNCRDGELTPKLELSFSGTSLSAKARFLPFQDAYTKETDTKWNVKIARSFSGLAASYTADFNGAWLERQEFILTDEQEPVSVKTAVIIKDDSLVWNLSFSRSW